MPIWSFGSRRSPASPEAVVERSPLGPITDASPHRFLIWVEEGDVARASSVLAEPDRLGNELTASAAGDRDDRGVPLEIASTFSPRTAAILRPLNGLSRAGVRVTGVEALDLVTELGDDALAAAVAAWGTHANNGPHRHRLEVLAGPELLEACFAHLAAADERGPNGRPAWRFAAMCVAANTAGSEPRMLEAALAASATDSSSLLDPVIHRAQTARLTGGAIEAFDEPLAELIRRRAYVSERAAHLAALLPSPLPESVADALCEAALRGGEASEPALLALAHAGPTERVHDTLERVLASDDPGAMAAALGPFADHWPDEARPVWRQFLASRSVPLRWAAEDTLGMNGSEEDVPDAAAQLAKLVRTKAKIQSSPPRGSALVDLLVRHADHPDARAALDDVTARWDRLADDMRGWLEAHHPELHPDRRQGDAAAAELEAVEPEEPLSWPPPTVERDGDAYLLSFDDGAAHSASRERFEELAEAHPQIEVLDGDREWLRLRIGAGDAEALVRQLWEEAGPA